MLLDDVKRNKFDNGLTLLTLEMHHAPIATVWAWFRVGSRNEMPGITGISHWVEHMLFKGGKEFGKGEIFNQVAANGGWNNGFTGPDYTAYFETLPSAKLDLGLRIERDRMVEAIVDPDEVVSERTVIISEREGAENYPRFLLGEAVESAAFTCHPYRWSVIGWKADLEAITREDLYNYYRKHYAPDNAILVVVGDINTKEVVERVHELYGNIAHKSQVDEVRSREPKQLGERRVLVKGPGKVHHMSMACHLPEYGHQDWPAISVLNGVLSGVIGLSFSSGYYGHKTSRLYGALVEKKLASNAAAFAREGVDPYLENIGVVLLPGVDPAVVESAITDEINKVRDKTVGDEELTKIKNLFRASLNYSFDGPTAAAMPVGMFERMRKFEDIRTFYDSIQEVTADDVKRVAETYLDEDNRTFGLYVPTGLGDKPVIDEGGGEMVISARGYIPMARLADAGEGGKALMPPVEKKKTANGIFVQASENMSSETVAFRFTFKSGSAYEGDLPAGVASITSSAMVRGTKTKTFQQIFEKVDSLGASLDEGTGMNTISFYGQCLATDFKAMADLAADVIRNPIFADDQVDLVKGQRLTQLKMEENNTHAVAFRELHHEFFEENHPYHRHGNGYIETVEAMKAGDLREFHRRRIRPERMLVTVVGGLEAGNVFGIVEDNFGDWQGEGDAPTEPDLTGGNVAGVQSKEVNVPGKTQCDIAIAFKGVPRLDEGYEALSQAINVYGQLGLMGRIGKAVRDEAGMAYYSVAWNSNSIGDYMWQIMAGVNPKNADKAKKIILAEVEKMRDELITEDEDKMLKDYLTGSFPLMFETMGRAAGALENPAIFGLPDDYYEKYIETARSVTREDIREAAKKYFDPENYTIVIAGPVEQIVKE
ncbi:MAG: insulinase family protein [Planctomycetota bacterium]|nr:MAG: insulinase family protein [Planctomycetota bacterium]